MSFLDHSPAEEWDAISKKRRAHARRVSEQINAEQRASEPTKATVLSALSTLKSGSVKKPL